MERPSKKIKVLYTGDDLEDNFQLEDDFAPASDEETGIDINNIEEKGGELLGEEEAVVVSVDAEVRKKRKRDKKEKTKSAKKLALGGAEEDDGVGPSMGLLSTEILADRLAEKQKKALLKLTQLESEDLKITEFMILDTSSVTDRSSLFSFIRAAVPTLPSTLTKPPKKEGAPRILVLAGAALRVADLCRDLKPYKTKEIEVAKLFAKHFKLADHVEFLRQKKVGIACGTPNRIGKLLEESDALQLTYLSHLILDVTHHNSKRQSLLDMKDSHEDLFKLVLGNNAILERLREGKMKIVFF